MSSLKSREITYALTYQDVVEILHLVKESADCESIELQLGDLKLSVSRASGERTARAGTQGRPPSAAAEDASSQPAEPVARGGEGGEAEIKVGLLAVRAPMLGTFYRAPAPGEPPYVEVGDVVGEGDTVGLIDVMKLFTQIPAGVSGRVVEILAENATLVEYGQPLVLIEPL